MTAGTINAVIGSGTLVTFPVLLAVGYPPVTANVTNGLGLVPGSLTAVHGYRRELRGHWPHALRLAAMSATGAVVGAILLLTLPADAFRLVVPVLIAGALVLVVLGPRIRARVDARRVVAAATPAASTRPSGRLRAAVGATGVYGGYFGAAQGVLLFALLGTSLPDELQRVNALRNLLAGTANAVSAAIFCVAADVAFDAAAVIAVGAAAGGVLGARIGRRLSPAALRAIVLVVGVVAIVQIVLD